MNILIVYAHPEPKSFNGALKDAAVEELQSQGHTVRISDLYRANFKAIADRGDFDQQSNPDFFKYQAEQAHASKEHGFHPEIQAELDRLFWADFVIFQFPLWWYSVPAILKGWFDRVFAAGTIYGGGLGRYSEGALRGRKAMLSVTVGSAESGFSPTGIDGDMTTILYHINHGMLYFSGMQPAEPYITYQPARASADERKAMLASFKQHMKAIDDIPLIQYHPNDHFDENHQLKPEHRI
ncbi:NAD(P)H-dependent oxidoreductase [Geomicrobium sediminis]|uniref:NAD(P)H dehydrogenase (Quinone) n=1 Tax=Geomicrobium sediminis TaxID=1347788 RepID=A0ABS2PHC5_9BACL|nr:NAD(P)H dehydrogenase (quinone) [Geomicrobium sediminis]